MASRGLVRVMRPHMDRRAYLYSSTEHSTDTVTGSRLSTVSKNSAGCPFCIPMPAARFAPNRRYSLPLLPLSPSFPGSRRITCFLRSESERRRERDDREEQATHFLERSSLKGRSRKPCGNHVSSFKEPLICSARPSPPSVHLVLRDDRFRRRYDLLRVHARDCRPRGGL
jgi:hypothetical protein